MSRKVKIATIFVLLILICGADRLTKNWAVQSLMDAPAIVYFNGLFQFTYAENAGAFLGLGGELSREVRFVIFSLVVLVGLGAMLWYVIKKDISRWNVYACAFIIAGGAGNLWDRLFRESGRVIDFMLIEIAGPLRTGVFNIADVFIVVGVLMALLAEYQFEKSKRAKSNPT